MIVDAHTHIFSEIAGHVAAGPTRGLGYGRIAIGDDAVQLMPPLSERVMHTTEMLIAGMDWAGVDAAVLLQGPFYGPCNDYAMEAVRHHSDRLVAAAYLDPWSDGWEKQLEQIIAEPRFVSVKLECSVETGLCGLYPTARLDEPRLRSLWKAIDQTDRVLTLDLGRIGSRSYQTDAVRQIAERFPTLTVVIAHLGQPRTDAERDADMWRQWKQQIDLGKLQNVYLDTAALPHYVAPEAYPFPSAGRYLNAAIDRIGPGKLMFGTDVPGILAYASYPQLVEATRQHLSHLDDEQRAQILGGNAARVYRVGCRDSQPSKSPHASHPPPAPRP